MWDEDVFKRKSYVEFKYVGYDDKGNDLVEITRRVIGEDAECLSNILGEFKFFLHGMTFNYVDEVTAETKNTLHSSEDY